MIHNNKAHLSRAHQRPERSQDIHINLNMILYTHVKHSHTKTTHTKHHTERQTTPIRSNMTFITANLPWISNIYLFNLPCWKGGFSVGSEPFQVNVRSPQDLALHNPEVRLTSCPSATAWTRGHRPVSKLHWPLTPSMFTKEPWPLLEKMYI